MVRTKAYACHAASRKIAMVCESIQSWAGAPLFALFRRLKLMSAINYSRPMLGLFRRARAFHTRSFAPGIGPLRGFRAMPSCFFF